MANGHRTAHACLSLIAPVALARRGVCYAQSTARGGAREPQAFPPQRQPHVPPRAAKRILHYGIPASRPCHASTARSRTCRGQRALSHSAPTSPHTCCPGTRLSWSWRAPLSEPAAIGSDPLLPHFPGPGLNGPPPHSRHAGRACQLASPMFSPPLPCLASPGLHSYLSSVLLPPIAATTSECRTPLEAGGLGAPL